MSRQRSLLYWQVVTIALLVVGYAGYYLCRSDLSVALPLIIDELGARGISADMARIRLGTIASLGVLAYAVGKFVSGGIADFLGGRRNFLAGMAGSVLCTVLFALAGGFPLFTMSWIANRLVQSTGWNGLLKIASRWFSYKSYGTVMGIICLSYLFGDAASRQFMAVLIGRGVGWRGVFFIAAGTLFVIFVVSLLLLRETPAEFGLKEPHTNPFNLYKSEGEDPLPRSLSDLLGPLMKSWAFWMVCVLSGGLTLVRETFNLWTPSYFNQVVGLSQAGAAQYSALFPLFGGISVLAAGYGSDRLGGTGRAAIIFFGMVLAGVALLVLGYGDFAGSKLWPVMLVTAIAFVMLGPYSYLSGAISLDFGGKHGSATACGIIDGVGYLGGIMAGDSIARISVAYGWKGAFAVLAVVAWLSSIAALAYLLNQRNTHLKSVSELTTGRMVAGSQEMGVESPDST
jgi:OPA family glycerol-3-phosphate transporter-like MFS transporter